MLSMGQLFLLYLEKKDRVAYEKQETIHRKRKFLFVHIVEQLFYNHMIGLYVVICNDFLLLYHVDD